MSYIDPDRHLNPPDIKEPIPCEWIADFACSLGDGDADVGVNCVVTRNDELDLDYLVVYYKGIDITDVLNAGLRNDIVRHFEVYFEDIKRACY